MSAARDDEDLALTLPLHGVQLIEASAGTGKTYTLAGLYLRLVVEEKMSVRDVLVVTFTKAATEKLRKELRTRLMLCAEAAANPDTAVSSPAQAQSRQLVAAALTRGEDAAALRVRLRLAALDLDSAQISTIHGFCQRALAEHGAAATVQGELVADDKDLIATLAADVYREHATA
ncbi:UvrD-helicase domain-containing protein, partial [Rudaea sp.]|uniref:UvrD-helicase domain-containing protein n=1 Tax=Rudaea sp. TaxID=2136325 RepID=UPI002ED5EF98